MPKHTYSGLCALIKSTLGSEADLMISFLDNLPNLPKAPASGALRYHHAYEGGLVDHIIDVYTIAKDLATTRAGETMSKVQINNADLLKVAILHDIHKVQDLKGQVCYEPNILKSGKRSEAEPFSKTANYFISETGAKGLDFLIADGALRDLPGGIQSLALVADRSPGLFAGLSDDVKFSIRYHDGAYGHNKYDLAGKETPLMIIFHCADMLSSRLNRA